MKLLRKSWQGDAQSPLQREPSFTHCPGKEGGQKRKREQGRRRKLVKPVT